MVFCGFYPKTKISLHFNGLFPGEPGLAVFIEVKDGGSGGNNWSYKTCKAPVKSSSPTNQHPVFLQARCPSCRPTNSVKALKEKVLKNYDIKNIKTQSFILWHVIGSKNAEPKLHKCIFGNE